MKNMKISKVTQILKNNKQVKKLHMAGTVAKFNLSGHHLIPKVPGIGGIT